MYKKSRIRIITLIMSVLLLLWIATLSIIYLTTYRRVATENKSMMELYAKEYAENGAPRFSKMERGDKIIKETSHRFRIAIFYSVVFKDGQTEVVNDGPNFTTDNELVEFAEQIMNKNKDFGLIDNMVYLVNKEQSYTIVVIMDNTIIGETMDLLVDHMLLFGGIAVVILLAVSFVLSSWIIRPLEENDRKQKQFISDAGHELKTPISTINANMEILERVIGENTWVSNIKYENARMETIVKQLLDLAKIQDVQPVFTDIDLSRIVMAGVLPFEAQAFETGITLTYNISNGIHINGSTHHVQMLVSTLLDNAFSHTLKEGAINLSLTKEHGKTQLIVSNLGAEIPVEERERIFDRFYRSNTARNSDGNHYGLGLAIAKGIVQKHHGKIYVTCNEGWTNFHVEF